MWDWIKSLFGFKKLCKKTEYKKLTECTHSDPKVLKKQINTYLKARSK